MYNYKNQMSQESLFSRSKYFLNVLGNKISQPMYIGLGSIFLDELLTYSKKWYSPVSIYKYY